MTPAARQPRKWHEHAGLATALADPRLLGAACAGQGPLFDLDHAGEGEEDRADRHRRAAVVCDYCPVRFECRTVARELGSRAEGVWAGRLHGTPPKRVGRPHKAAS